VRDHRAPSAPVDATPARFGERRPKVQAAGLSGPALRGQKTCCYSRSCGTR